VLRSFGCVVRDAGVALQQDAARVRIAAFAGMRHFAGTTAALSLTALAWGFINFGLLLWMPATLVAKGYSMALSSELLAASALIALPTVFVAAFLYSRWSSKGALLAAIMLTAIGLAGVIHLESAPASAVSPVWSIAVLIVGVNGIIAMLLPYAAESYPLKVRGRATGWAAACTKAGGLAAQFLGIFGVVPALFTAALLTLVPVLLSLLLVGWFCVETRGRDLRDLEMETVHAE
jgi:putative MFS transporter